MLVGDLMTEKVVFAREADTLDTLYDAMLDNRIRHLPVVNSDGEVVGIVSHRDLVGSALSTQTKLPISEVKQTLRMMRADEIMTREVEVTDPLEPIREAGLRLLENQLGCLPVVDGLKLIGILTEADFVRYLCEQERTEEEIESGIRLRRQSKLA